MKKDLKQKCLVFLLAIIIIFVTFYFGVKNTGKFNDINFNDKIDLNVESKKVIISNLKEVSLLEIQQHNHLGDCWVGFEGKAYDISDFLPKHKGTANAILPYCGTIEEFEEAFAKKHGKSKVSLFMKISLYIGDIVQSGLLE